MKNDSHLISMTEAAERGNIEAQFFLGLYYYKGKGGTVDMAEGAKWFQLAAEQGYSEAQFSLGLCYEHGDGVDVDFIEAYKWFLLAEATEKERVDEMRSALTKKMAPEHIAEAHARAKQWHQERKEKKQSHLAKK